uniref:Peptidase C1A papain C-terminal domain-containing protein n=1 Tax=Mucochytrium quahogii TaxID=96639 RepID=A0A7S2WJ20_9STRA|mmetsp:Transcript_2795/g.4025  ORF Transcript_2795/g.4025 Transcript_2795/m.4025 type:complete len:410 (-) Transcript_2795:392-1621(-)
MKFYCVAISSFLFCVSVAEDVLSQSLRDNFTAYLSAFAVSIPEADFDYRLQVYADNLQAIEDHNNDPSHSTIWGITGFAHLTENEFRAAYVSSSEPSLDWNRSSVGQTLSVDPASLPREVNLAVDGKITEVRDQGNCGSCYLFATTTVLESSYAIAMNIPHEESTFSTMQSIACDPDINCEGGYFSTVKNYLYGAPRLCQDWQYPYSAKEANAITNSATHTDCDRDRLEWCDPNPFLNDATLGDNVLFNTPLIMGMLTKANSIVNYGVPVMISMRAESLSPFYVGGIITAETCASDIAKSDASHKKQEWHAVVVVGYGEASDGTKYWVAQNSWSTRWGTNADGTTTSFTNTWLAGRGGFFLFERDASLDESGGVCEMFESYKIMPFAHVYTVEEPTLPPTVPTRKSCPN